MLGYSIKTMGSLLVNFNSMRKITLLSVVSILSAGVLAADNNYKAPRAADGIHPDFNGIWQVMNEANYDVEMHMARRPWWTHPYERHGKNRCRWRSPTQPGCR